MGKNPEKLRRRGAKDVSARRACGARFGLLVRWRRAPVANARGRVRFGEKVALDALRWRAACPRRKASKRGSTVSYALRLEP